MSQAGGRAYTALAHASRFALLCSGCLAIACSEPPPAEPEPPRHILFILIDTLRSDHLGCYGYSRNTSPHLDALAERGVVFDNVFSVAPWTNPAVATLFTGMYPQAILPAATHREGKRQPLPEQVETLAELLGRSGYRTVALMDHPGINPDLNYDQGFDVFVPLNKKFDSELWSGTDPALVVQEFHEQLDEVGQDRLFLYVHLIYPHRPYDPEPPYAGMFGKGFEKTIPAELPGMINFYDSEIRQTDDLVGELIGTLEERGLLESTAVVITSDHGEGFGEHGIAEHGNSLYNELLRVPLIVTGVWPPRRVGTPVSNVDVFPTVLEIAGVAPPGDIEGRSLARLLGDAEEGESWIFSQSPTSEDIHAHAAIHEGLKYILDRGPRSPKHQLFDLDQNPEENKNLARHEPERGKLMHERLKSFVAGNAQIRKRWVVEQRTLSERTRQQLEALGYTEEEFRKSFEMNAAVPPPESEAEGAMSEIEGEKSLSPQPNRLERTRRSEADPQTRAPRTGP